MEYERSCVKALNPIKISGKEVLPLIEGGKGVSVSTGESSGAFAKAGGVGTFSGVNADSYDENGQPVPQIYTSKTRRDRQKELVDYAIAGGITQAQRAHDIQGNEGRLHINILWEMGAAEEILLGILDKTKGLIHGVTCGAGMPYRISSIAAAHNIYYYPIVSSARAFRALWKRAFHKDPEWLGGVVYEDPWLAGGHNGLSNSESPTQPEDPYPRVKALRSLMTDLGLGEVPIVMAGGVWYLRDWQNWIDNPELGPIAFQFGTRPLLTQESPISDDWKQRLVNLQKGDILLQKFSPTGFYSSAVRNDFMKQLEQRSARQIDYRSKEAAEDGFNTGLPIGARGRNVYVSETDYQAAQQWIADGFNEALRTPDDSLVFVTESEGAEILKDQGDCMGCLSQCRFSNWAQNEKGTNGQRADPRSFCIQKSLQDIAHNGSIHTNLMFAGHQAYQFSQDPFYADGFIPTVKQLVDRIMTGD